MTNDFHSFCFRLILIFISLTYFMYHGGKVPVSMHAETQYGDFSLLTIKLLSISDLFDKHFQHKKTAAIDNIANPLRGGGGAARPPL